MHKLNKWLVRLAIRICFFGEDLLDDMPQYRLLFVVRPCFFLEELSEPRLCSLAKSMDTQFCGENMGKRFMWPTTM